MKKLFFVSGLLLLSGYLVAQARDGTDELQKSDAAQAAAVIHLPYAPVVVKKALNDYLFKNGEKAQDKAEGFLISSNTVLVKNNINNANIYLQIGAKDEAHLNETVIYLKLNSAFDSPDKSSPTNVLFDMQDAKNYLDNLAVAIKPYAAGLQLELQEKNLANAEAKSASLKNEGSNLEKTRKGIEQEMAATKSNKSGSRLAKRKLRNDQLIADNHIDQQSQISEVNRQ